MKPVPGCYCPICSRAVRRFVRFLVAWALVTGFLFWLILTYYQ
jgi:hypothetical protein